MHPQPTRRAWLAGTAGGLAAVSTAANAAEPRHNPPAFRFCLNTSTIRGQKLPLVEEIDIAAKAGYHAIEPWISELDQYVKGGGSLKDLGKRIRDLGLVVETPSASPSGSWTTTARRKKGLEKRAAAMDLVRADRRQAASPPRRSAPPTRPDLDLLQAAERYRALLEIGDKIGVVPQVEVWGFSKSLSRLGEAALVAIESGHPEGLHPGRRLPPAQGRLRLRRPASSSAPPRLQVFHMNDYPADPPRASDHRRPPRLPRRRRRPA